MPVKPQFKIGIKNKVQNAVDGVLELYFLDVIQNEVEFDWWSGTISETNLLADIIKEVKSVNPSVIRCYIDSLGGDLGLALSIYNFLKHYNARVEVEIIGMCMSAATVIAAAASKGKLKMPKNGFYVIHEASGCTEGTSAQIREYADVVDKHTDQVAAILSQRNTKGKTKEQVAALWAAGDCWMDGTEAETEGFIDEAYNSESNVTARVIEASRIYNNVPASALEETTAEEEEVIPEPEEGTTITQTINNFFMDFKKNITAFMDGIKGKSVTNTGGVIDLHSVLETPITNLVTGMQEEVTAEMEALRTDNAANKTSITNLTKIVEDLQAEITNKAGGEAKPKNENETGVKGFGKGVGGKN